MSSYLPLARILSRYLAPVIIGKGILPDDVVIELTQSEDFIYLVAGVLSAAVTEIGYRFAKKNGGAT